MICELRHDMANLRINFGHKRPLLLERRAGAVETDTYWQRHNKQLMIS